MSGGRLTPWIAMVLGLGLTGCGEPEVVNAINVKIVEMEDFTDSAGYGNGCRFTIQIVNNTEDQLEKLEAFVTEDGDFLFSVSSELPPMGRLNGPMTFNKTGAIGKSVSHSTCAKKCTMSTISEDTVLCSFTASS